MIIFLPCIYYGPLIIELIQQNQRNNDHFILASTVAIHCVYNLTEGYGKC